MPELFSHVIRYLQSELLHASTVLQAKQGKQELEVTNALDLNTCTIRHTH